MSERYPSSRQLPAYLENQLSAASANKQTREQQVAEQAAALATSTATKLATSELPLERARPALAVALHYSGNGAPRVTAKGSGQIAQTIVETARKHGVPLEQDAALVSALSRVDLDREIPRELWLAVAHVLTFAWSVAEKKKNA